MRVAVWRVFVQSGGSGVLFQGRTSKLTVRSMSDRLHRQTAKFSPFWCTVGFPPGLMFGPLHLEALRGQWHWAPDRKAWMGPSFPCTCHVPGSGLSPVHRRPCAILTYYCHVETEDGRAQAQRHKVPPAFYSHGQGAEVSAFLQGTCCLAVWRSAAK